MVCLAVETLGAKVALRVLVLTPFYPWPGDPPEAIFVHRQVKNLVRCGLECRVLTYRPAVRRLPHHLAACSWLRYHPRWLTWPRAQDGIPVSHVFYPRRHRGEDVIPSIGETLVRFVESHPEYRRTDLVYAHWLWTGGAAALHLRERYGWPVATIARGSEMHDWHYVHPHSRPHVERVLNLADLVLANCHGLRRRAEEIVPGTADRIRVVYNGCDASAFGPGGDKTVLRKRLGLPVDAKLLMCCASIIERKGIRELIEAWRAFAPRHPGWRLVIVGRLVRPELVQQLHNADSSRITLVGRVAANRIAQYLQAADGYIQPSLLEGLANATMEAMATSLPVIATDTGGQREAVHNGSNGWLVPAGDGAALAGAMREMASDSAEAGRRGVAARRTIQRDFDPMRHAAHLSDLLHDLVRRGRRSDAYRDQELTKVPA